MGDEDEPVAVRAPNGRIVGLAQPHGVLADGVEHGLSVGPGARDDAEDRGSRRLMLQRFRKLLLRVGRLAGLLVALFFIERRGTVRASSRQVLAPGKLFCPRVGRFHIHTARRCTDWLAMDPPTALRTKRGAPQGYHTWRVALRGFLKSAEGESAVQYSTPVRSEMGLVSRVTPVQTAMRNCTRDEGRSFEVGNQVLISNHRKLLWSKAMVVNVAEKPEQDSGRYD